MKLRYPNEPIATAPAKAVARLYGGRNAVVLKYTSHRAADAICEIPGIRKMHSIDFAIYVRHNAATGFCLVPEMPSRLPKGVTVPRTVPRDLFPSVRTRQPVKY